MTDERPLHVRVAEALGCSPRPPHDGLPWWSCTCAGEVHNEPRDPDLRAYDTDWSATGPLIERYGIAINRRDKWELEPEEAWHASMVYGKVGRTFQCLAADGPTPLTAVCNLILDLAAEDLLPSVKRPS